MIKKKAIDVYCNNKHFAFVRGVENSSVRKLIGGFAFTFVAHGYAQVPDPALEFQRQQQRQQELQHGLDQASPDVRLPRTVPGTQGQPVRLPAGESPCFPLHRVALEGEMSGRFQWLVAQADIAADGQSDPISGKCLGTAGINMVLQRMQNALIASGYVTSRVLASPQDLKSGVLATVLVPGRLREVRIRDSSNGRATVWNALPVRSGDVLNLRDIEQGLENLKRAPTADANIQIEAVADQVGYSDLVVSYKQDFPFRVQVDLDNSGTKSTGKYQGGITFSYDNALTLNDLFYANFSHDLGGGDSGKRGSNSNLFYYSIPFGYWLLSTSISHNSYDQSVAGATQNYLYRGKSDQAEVQLSRIVWRNASHKLSVNAKVFQRRSRNYIDDTEIEVQRRATGGWGIGADHRAYLGDAVVDAKLAYRRGTGAFNSIAAPEEAFGEGTSRFKIMTASVSLNLPFRAGEHYLRYSSNIRGQWSNTPLAPQERFAIGGAYTVRGFDGESSLMAQRGLLVRNDLGVALGSSGQEAYVGLDYGHVSGAGAEWLLGRTLVGAAVGLRGAYAGLQYDAFAGWPLRKPEGFRTADTTLGMSLSYQF